MKNKRDKYDYSSIFRCFKLYEYIYECAKKELDERTELVSDRTERLVIDYPDRFIKKYLSSSGYFNDDREIIYGLLRSKKLSLLMWTDDNRTLCGAGKDTIHIIKPDYFSRGTLEDITFLLKNLEKS